MTWRGRVLLVDDEPQIREPFAGWLRSRGYDVLEAVNGAHGLEVARAEQPRIAIVDVMMPEMSGWDLTRELKQSDDTRHIRVLVLTSIGSALNEMSSRLYGADAQMDKPFEYAAVEREIQRLVTTE